MADPTLTNQLLILLGDGATPTETFSHPCGANARSVKFLNNTGEDSVLDCSNPLGAPAVIKRWTESQDTTLEISGKIGTESMETWRAWRDNGDEKNIRVEIHNSESPGGYYTLPAILQEFELTSEGTSRVSFSASIVGAGRRTWTDYS